MPDKKPISLSPLDTKKALKGLFDIPDPDATHPKAKDKKAKRKKTPPPDKGERDA